MRERPQRPAPAAAPVRTELLDGGAEAFPAMLAAIDAARRDVLLEVYAFSPSGVGARFVAALSAAARRGVRVRVVIDGWGSALGASEVSASLRAAGAEVEVFNPLLAILTGRLRRNHRKILAVDGEVAFVGGINVADAYGVPDPPPGAPPPWADLALRFGGPAAAFLLARGRRERDASPPAAVRVWLSGLAGGLRLRRRYLRSFDAARRSLLVAHAYFLPDRRMVRSITAAARRGVSVRLVLAGRSDVALARPATRRHYRRLLHAGVAIREWRRSVLHAKVAAIDGARLLVGSFNLDPLSLANLEALAETTEPGAVARGEAWIQARWAEGEPVTLADLGAASALERWLEGWLGRLVSRATRWLAQRLRRSA